MVPWTRKVHVRRWVSSTRRRRRPSVPFSLVALNFKSIKITSYRRPPETYHVNLLSEFLEGVSCRCGGAVADGGSRKVTGQPEGVGVWGENPIPLGVESHYSTFWDPCGH